MQKHELGRRARNNLIHELASRARATNYDAERPDANQTVWVSNVREEVMGTDLSRQLDSEQVRGTPDHAGKAGANTKRWEVNGATRVRGS